MTATNKGYRQEVSKRGEGEGRREKGEEREEGQERRLTFLTAQQSAQLAGTYHHPTLSPMLFTFLFCTFSSSNLLFSSFRSAVL